MSTLQNTSTIGKAPTYFLSIGGPNFMENTTHPAYGKLSEVGNEITQKVKPKAIVVFSAHWSPYKTKIAVNVAEHPDLIYDFYGFPPHYYEFQYPNKGSPEIAETVIEKLEGAGIEVERVNRGLDHGVWVGFLAAFDPKTNPLNVPIIQVSLFDNEDVQQHYRLGEALQSLREQGIVIIGAGMAAHNLLDFRAMRQTGHVTTKPYTSTFDDAMSEAATTSTDAGERLQKMTALMQRDDTRQAHPTIEHLLPMYVAAGAAGSDQGQRLWTFPEGSLNWAQYRFG